MVGGTSCSSSDRLADSNGNNAISYIPDDLIIEVLSRLPGKALLKFMCVSKSWRNFISNSLPTSPLSILLVSSPYRANRKDIFIPLLRSASNCLEPLQSHCASLGMTVIHHCNGLFLLSDDAPQDVETSYYVCNPATNQCVALPDPMPFSYQRCDRSALVFDPRKSSHYKVVRIGGFPYVSGVPFNQLEVQIFSSDENQWVSFIAYSRPGCTCGRHLYMDWSPKRLTYLNGALHFLCDFDQCMISFYVEEKRFGESKLPNTIAEPQLETQSLGESEGRLYYVACHHDKLEIWMLQSLDPDRWFVKHTLHFANLGKDISPSNYLDDSECIDIVAFHTNLEVLFINKGGVIFSCYFGSGRKDIDRLEEVRSIGRYDTLPDFVSPYSRCLVSLKDLCNRRGS